MFFVQGVNFTLTRPNSPSASFNPSSHPDMHCNGNKTKHLSNCANSTYYKESSILLIFSFSLKMNYFVDTSYYFFLLFHQASFEQVCDCFKLLVASVLLYLTLVWYCASLITKVALKVFYSCANESRFRYNMLRNYRAQPNALEV